MNKILDKTKLFIFSKQKSIFSSAMILAVMIIVARFFGFLRYRTLASFFYKDELDIILASFRVPDLIFEILITGALTSSFIPIFIKYQHNKKDLDENISSIINLILILMFFLISILFLFTDKIIPLITPGYVNNPEKINNIILFSRLLLIGQLPFMILGSFLTGIGQANKTFFIPALAPIVYNVAIIIATIAFAPNLYLLGPVIGVIVGAVFFFLIQLPLIYHSNFSFQLIVKKTAGLVDFLRVMVPRALTVIMAQIDATVDLVLTTLLGAGSYTVFYFAQHLQLLPVSVVGVAFGQAALPYLTEVYQQRRFEEFKKIIADSILNLFFFSIPIASFFIFARTPLVRLFFGGHKFDWEATVQTAITLSYFSLSLPFHTIYYFLTRCFYAFMDTKTPFIISAFTIAFNTILSIVFVTLFKFPVWSLAGAFSFSMILNVFFLVILLAKKTDGLDFRFIIFESVKITASTIISSFVTYYLMKFMDGLIFNTSYTINVFFLLATGTIIYFALYLFLAWFLDVREIYLISKLILKAKEYQRKIVEVYTSYE